MQRSEEQQTTAGTAGINSTVVAASMVSTTAAENVVSTASNVEPVSVTGNAATASARSLGGAAATDAALSSASHAKSVRRVRLWVALAVVASCIAIIAGIAWQVAIERQHHEEQRALWRSQGSHIPDFEDALRAELEDALRAKRERESAQTPSVAYAPRALNNAHDAQTALKAEALPIDATPSPPPIAVQRLEHVDAMDAAAQFERYDPLARTAQTPSMWSEAQFWHGAAVPEQCVQPANYANSEYSVKRADESASSRAAIDARERTWSTPALVSPSVFARLASTVFTPSPPHRAFAAALTGCKAAWQWPLTSHTIVHEFNPPDKPWLAGNRGVDLAALQGTALFAPSDGVIHFAGNVGGKQVVSIRHGALISTYEPAVTNLSVGAAVKARTQFGVVQGVSDHCADQCMHWGVKRLDGSYVDPVSMVKPQKIVLKPVA